MSNLNFVSYCGLCYTKILPSKGGVVLSCGDFVCSICVPSNVSLNEQKCPICHKNNVNSLRLNADMPEDVLDKMSDLNSEFESLHESLTFQIKHYKRVLANLSNVIQERDKVINDLNRQILYLRGHVQSDSQSQDSSYRPQPTNIHSMRLKDVGDAESINKADKNDNSLLITASKSHPSFKNYNSSEPTTPRTDDYRTLHNNIASTTVSNLRPLSAQSNSSQVSFQSQTGGVNTGKDLPPLGSKRPYATVEQTSRYSQSNSNTEPPRLLTQSAHFTSRANATINEERSRTQLSLNRPSAITRPMTNPTPTPSRIRSPHLPIVRGSSPLSSTVYRPLSGGTQDSKGVTSGYEFGRRK